MRESLITRPIGVKETFRKVLSRDTRYESILEYLGEDHPIARHLILHEKEAIDPSIRGNLLRFLWLSNPQLKGWKYSGNQRQDLPSLRLALLKQMLLWWRPVGKSRLPDPLMKIMFPAIYTAHQEALESKSMVQFHRTHYGWLPRALKAGKFTQEALLAGAVWGGHTELVWMLNAPLDEFGDMDKASLAWCTRPRPLWIRDKVLKKVMTQWVQRSPLALRGNREDYIQAGVLWADMYGSGTGNPMRVAEVCRGNLWVDIADGVDFMERWVKFMERAAHLFD